MTLKLFDSLSLSLSLILFSRVTPNNEAIDKSLKTMSEVQRELQQQLLQIQKLTTDHAEHHKNADSI